MPKPDQKFARTNVHSFTLMLPKQRNTGRVWLVLACIAFAGLVSSGFFYLKIRGDLQSEAKHAIQITGQQQK